MVISRAPVRICDIGGWTDTWFYPNGAVFNICVDLYSYVRIVESNNDKVRIFAENIKEYVEIKNHSEIEYNGNLDLLKAAIKRIKILGGMDIFIRAEAPPACGTGTSASVAVALVSALARWQEIEMNPLEVAKLAHLLEIEELKLESGVQDQYAAASGGINFMEVNYPDVKLHKIQVSKKRILELENQLILVYLSSRSSSKMHQAVIRNFKNKDNLTMENFDIMKECAYEMKSAINSNIEKVGEIINRNWEAQKKLHPKMTNSYIDKLEKIFALREEIIKNGYQILPCKLSFNGVESFNL
ncbi:MAG: GHMP family kinase ATP-binding protein [Promethearchaeota archaeon]